jgi:predicted HicB family RNase H-like nuclease
MTRDLGYYLSLKYPYTVEEEEENGRVHYKLEIPDLPGCWAEGKNLKEARKNLDEAKSLWIEEAHNRKLAIPEPSKEFSGRILLRIPPLLHGQLNKHARKAGLSLNQFIRNLLEAGLNFSSLTERLDHMGKAIQGIEQKLSLQNTGIDQWATTHICRGFALGDYYPVNPSANIYAFSGTAAKTVQDNNMTTATISSFVMRPFLKNDLLCDPKNVWLGSEEEAVLKK